ncbi:hypothetical protein PO124_25720 [Bacillus licheniformis]|nr:hypothetical protein [Bacillus licheniformis]
MADSYRGDKRITNRNKLKKPCLNCLLKRMGKISVQDITQRANLNRTTFISIIKINTICFINI